MPRSRQGHDSVDRGEASLDGEEHSHTMDVPEGRRPLAAKTVSHVAGPVCQRSSSRLTPLLGTPALCGGYCRSLDPTAKLTAMRRKSSLVMSAFYLIATVIPV